MNARIDKYKGSVYYDDTALNIAVHCSYSSTVKLLLEAGADANAIRHFRETPLDACGDQSATIEKYIRKAGGKSLLEILGSEEKVKEYREAKEEEWKIAREKGEEYEQKLWGDYKEALKKTTSLAFLERIEVKMQIHLGDIQLKLCEGSFHEDNNKENIQYIPLVNAEVTIWNRDKTKVLYHNTASDNGVLEFSNCEIEDDEFALYLEIKHQDFEETPIGGNLYVRKGMENQENRIYFKRIKLRLKHAPFASLQNPKEFYQALNPSNEERETSAETKEDKENDWDTLVKRAEEIRDRNEAILREYESKGTEKQFASKRKRHEKQRRDLEGIKGEKTLKNSKISLILE